MPVVVKRLTPANFEPLIEERPFTLVRVGSTARVAFHEGLVEYFAATRPGVLTFAVVLRNELPRTSWLAENFVSAVGPVRGGIGDGYYLLERGLVVGHHRGEVRDNIHYGDPAELAEQRQHVLRHAFGGRRVPPPTLEAVRAIVTYFDDVLNRKLGATNERSRWVHEDREPATAPATATVDPYEVLGVTRQATDDEVKAAYRESLKMNHPDKVAHLSAALQKFAEAQTIAIVDAYEQIRKERGAD